MMTVFWYYRRGDTDDASSSHFIEVRGYYCITDHIKSDGINKPLYIIHIPV